MCLMQITLNGQPHPLSAPCTVAALMDALGLDVRKVAVERNRTIVPRTQHETTTLMDGDEIEIVQFIGGG